MNKDLALIKIQELAASYNTLHNEILADPNRLGLEDGYMELLVRWDTLARILISGTGRAIESYDSKQAVKMMFLDLREQLDGVKTGGAYDKILPQASILRLESEVDTILEALKDVTL